MPAQTQNSTAHDRPRLCSAVPSLRPPTLMIDLLFGALMLFAFHMGDPSSRIIDAKEVQLPTANGTPTLEALEPVTLHPLKDGQTWLFETAEGKQLTAADVRQTVGEDEQVILIMSGKDTIQLYVSAEQALKAHDIAVTMAVELMKERD